MGDFVLVFGLFTRLVALTMMITMLVATIVISIADL
ncbi:MAG: DoxX family membrane protein [Ignavibacteriaceae bacterium]